MNSVTDLTVKICNLDSRQQKALSNCIINYSYQPNSLCERIQQFIYLFVEHGKMYIGCSDWDKAVNALEQKSFQIIPVPFIYFLPESSIRSTSELGVNALIKLNHYQTPPIPEFITDYIASRFTIDDAPEMIEKILIFSLSRLFNANFDRQSLL